MKSFARRVLFSTLLLAATGAVAQTNPGSGWMVETDPATFVLNGYSGHVRLRLSGNEEAKHWVVGLGSYGMEFPEPLRKMALQNSPGGSKLAIDSGYGIFIDRYFSDDQQGWFAGLQLGRQRYSLKDNGQSEHYDATIFMPRVGYHHNLGQGWYVLPWAGVAHVSSNKETLHLNGHEVSPRSTIGFVTVHIGYQF